MVKEEILEGLKYAISKGEQLPKAMMSFYNAGYSKKDIEEAARALQVPQLPQIQQTPQIPKATRLTKKSFQKPIQTQASYQPSPAPAVVQRVSAYEKEPRKGGNLLVIMLVFFLILLLGILVAVFLFRDELADFLSRIL